MCAGLRFFLSLCEGGGLQKQTGVLWLMTVVTQCVRYSPRTLTRDTQMAAGKPACHAIVVAVPTQRKTAHSQAKLTTELTTDH